MLKWQERQARDINDLCQKIKTYKKKSRDSKYITRIFLKNLAEELNEWREKFQRNSSWLTKLAEKNEESSKGFQKIVESTMDKYEKFENLIIRDSNRIHVSKMLRNTSTPSKIKKTTIKKSKAKIETADASAGADVTNTSEANKSHKRKTDKRSKTSEGPTPKRRKSGIPLQQCSECIFDRFYDCFPNFV